VYAHSPTTLYRMDPIGKEVSLVGDFDCITNTEMWDIAIDSTGYMVGSGPDRLVKIDPANATCKTLAKGTFPNSLTFIPKGTLDAEVEALVGFRESEYVRIDPVNGKITVIGNLNPNPSGKDWESSGDVVSIIDDKTYLTVHPVATSWLGSDTIVEVDPITGKVVKVIGDTGTGKLWGLAYWDSVAFGFSSDGALVQIDLGTGAGKSVPLPNKPVDLSFYGAGVTTAARIKPPT
jgi:glutamine cyclotransferase